MNDQDPLEEIPRPIGTLITAVILTLTTLWIAIRMHATIEGFRELFVALGVTDLPAITRFVLRLPYAFWLFAAASIPLLVWVMVKQRVTRDESRRMKFALGALVVATLLAYALLAYAVYTPMFKLGATV